MAARPHDRTTTDDRRPALSVVGDTPPASGSPASLAHLVGADDLLVLRQVAPGRFLQVGGTGRGDGWAGCLEVSLVDEPALRAAVTEDRTTRWQHPEPRRVLGPYYARQAALVPVDHDVAVLFGGDHDLAPDDDLSAAAVLAAGTVESLSPAKRLADELELLSAVRAVMQCRSTDVRDALTHVATAAAEALSCEVTLAWLPEAGHLVVVERGWSLSASDAELRVALAQVLALTGEQPLCAQDSDSEPLPAPLGPDSGVRSHYVLPLGSPSFGVLVLLHTVVAPRGFTTLCRTIGEKIAEAGAVVVQSTVVHEELQRLVERAEVDARRDPLTGVGNRLAWEEGLTAVAGTVAAGEPASVVIVDLNGLKAVNDAYGHARGDRLLQACAAVLGSVARRRDVLARLGGDEFGLLLPGVDGPTADRIVDRVRAAFSSAGQLDRTPLSAAVGAATCPPGDDLRAAVRRADAQMYVDKRGRRPA